ADPDMTPGTPPAGLPPEQERQLLAASTTLRRVPPLAEPARADLNRIVGGAPVVAWMEERDRKREQLATRTHDLEFMRDQQAHPPENGTPPMREEVDAVAQEVDRLT